MILPFNYFIPTSSVLESTLAYSALGIPSFQVFRHQTCTQIQTLISTHQHCNTVMCEPTLSSMVKQHNFMGLMKKYYCKRTAETCISKLIIHIPPLSCIFFSSSLIWFFRVSLTKLSWDDKVIYPPPLARQRDM